MEVEDRRFGGRSFDVCEVDDGMFDVTSLDVARGRLVARVEGFASRWFFEAVRIDPGTPLT